MESWCELNSSKRSTLTSSKSVGGSYAHSLTASKSVSVGSYSHSPTQLKHQHQIVAYSHQQDLGPLPKLSKSKSTSWHLDESELKRRRRVASYKVYSVEGRVKSSFRKSFRWFKDKLFEMRYGWYWKYMVFLPWNCHIYVCFYLFIHTHICVSLLCVFHWEDFTHDETICGWIILLVMLLMTPDI